MEQLRQTGDIIAHFVRLAGFGGIRDRGCELVDVLKQIEFLFVRDQFVMIRKRDVRSRTQNRTHPRVSVLSIVDRVFVGLLLRHVDIEIHVRIRSPGNEEVPDGIDARFLHQIF